MRFIICGNDETLLNSDLTEYDSDMAVRVVNAGERALWDAGVAIDEYDVDSCFRNWNGGRHRQFRECCGHVSIPKDAPKSDEEIAFRASDAMDAEIAKITTEVEESTKC